MGRLLITGANGLVGSQFTGDVIQITSKVCDLRDKKQTESVFDFYTDKTRQKDYAVDKVIHCAAKVGGVGGNMNYKGEFFYDNIMINTNVIEAARKSGVQKLVAFLSTCVFPNDVEYPLTEGKIHLGPPHFSNDAYAYAKRMADVQIRAYREQYGLNYTSVIPTNIYGPNDNFNIQNGHVIPSLIHKCYLARENGTDLTIWGSGKPLREFIHAKDVAELSKWVLENYNESEPIILSTSEEISIKDVVDIIVENMNFKGNVIFDKEKPDGQFRKPSDNSKITSYLPDFKFTPFEIGIKETIEWFEKTYPNVKY
ncbi:MAG: GDP-L-fucose synthase [Spirochaetes bacterium]|nr:MAG: GDP-L-fucose synthase [Spirochaetota bacterium]